MTAFRKHDSVASFTSDQLDEEEETSCLEFSEAPYDVSGFHKSLGEVVIVKMGTSLPVTTKWMKKEGSECAIKFQVDKELNVKVVAERPVKTKPSVNAVSTLAKEDFLSKSNYNSVDYNGSTDIGHSETRNFESKSFASNSSNDIESQRPIPIIMSLSKDDSIQSDIDMTSVSTVVLPVIGPCISSKKKMSTSEFLTKVDNCFKETIIDGIESGVRQKVTDKMNNGMRLAPAENMKVIHALNQAYYEEFGGIKPPEKVRESLAGILKNKFPQTYKTADVVKTSFGALKIKRAKGEGGHSDLSTRIGDAFYDKFLRPSVKKPTGSLNQTPCAVKKVKRVYGITPDKWELDTSASEVDKENAKTTFEKLYNSSDSTPDEKLQLMLNSAIFIQEQMKLLEPSEAVEHLKPILSDPTLLSVWFEYMVEGSKDGGLSTSVELQLSKVMGLVEQYLLSKKGSDYEAQMYQAKQSSEQRFGNDIEYKVILLKELSKVFRNKSEKILFVDGKDEIGAGANDQQPNLFIFKQSSLGIDEYVEKLIISVRVGEKVLFNTPDFCQAIAAVVQLYFIFNIFYPPEADDICQFLQRILCNFMDGDGARNSKGVVKKCFRDFESFVAKVLLEANQGELLALVT